MSCFTLSDRLFQDQFRHRIRQELIDLDTQTDCGRVAAEDQMRRVLGTLADGNESPSQLAGMLDEDLMALAGPDRKPVAVLRREGKSFTAVNAAPSFTDGRRLEEVAGEYYFLTTYRTRSGWIVTGRQWLRALPTGTHSSLLVRGGQVVKPMGLASTTPVELCDASGGPCEIKIDGKKNLLIRSAANDPKAELQALLVLPIDALATPLHVTSRGILIVGVILSILGAVGVTLMTRRTVARPLAEITESCARVNDSCKLADFEIPGSAIAEVNALGLTLRSAVETIEVGQTKLTQAHFQFMGAIVAMLDARDRYTAGHSHRVSAFSEALARHSGLSPCEVEDIRVGALLHDIGKIGVPDEVLQKHNQLTWEEFELMKQHPTIGRKILEQVSQFDKYLDAVEMHHENLDGTGYPRGLRGDQIPVSARIVKVADVYDALSTDRPYRKGMPPEEVHALLRKESGTHFDRLLVDIFLTRCVPQFEANGGLNNLRRAVGRSGPIGAMKKGAGV